MVEYGEPRPVAAADVEDGDLTLVDDEWVVVENSESDALEAGQHVIDWRSAGAADDFGSLLQSSDEPVMVRQPIRQD